MPTKKQLKRRANINLGVSLGIFLLTMSIIASNNLIQYFNYLGLNLTSESNAILSLVSLFLVGSYLIWSILTKLDMRIYN